MTVKDVTEVAGAVAALAGALAWLFAVLVIACMLGKPVKKVLNRLATILTLKAVKLKLFGAEVELTPDVAERAWEKFLLAIADVTNGLSAQEMNLIERIRASGGQETVEQIFPNFSRDMPEQLEQLRNLRDRLLVRPREGSSWKAWKHPVLTRFGETAYDISKQISKET
jgi:hypothetical protein